MNDGRNVLLHAGYILAGVAAGLVAPEMIGTVSQVTSFLVGSVVFLGAVLGHEIVLRRSWQEKSSKQIVALKRAYDDLRSELTGLRNDTMSILQALNSRAKARMKQQESPQGRAQEHNQENEQQAHAANAPGMGPSVLYVKREQQARGAADLPTSAARRRSVGVPNIELGIARAEGPRQVTAKTLRVEIGREEDDVEVSHKAHPRDFLEDRRLSHARQSLRDGNVIHKIQPVVALTNRRPVYYECFSYIPNPEGTGLWSPSEFSVSDPKNVKFVQAIDVVMLSNTMEIIARLKDYDSGLEKVFVNVSPGVLQAPLVLERLVNMAQKNPQIQDILVFEFAHDDITSGRISKAALAGVSRLGFALSIQNITSFDLDIDFLVLHNVKFLKISSLALYDLSRAAVDDQDLRKFQVLRRNALRMDLKLIAEKIEDENTLRRVSELGIRYGMGFLLGRPERIDLVAGSISGVYKTEDADDSEAGIESAEPSDADSNGNDKYDSAAAASSSTPPSRSMPLLRRRASRG